MKSANNNKLYKMFNKYVKKEDKNVIVKVLEDLNKDLKKDEENDLYNKLLNLHLNCYPQYKQIVISNN